MMKNNTMCNVQKTLFPTENKEKKHLPNSAPQKTPKTLTPTPMSQLDRQVEEWKKQKKQQKENIAYMKIEYIAEVHLDETREGFNVETALERNHRPEGDSYGGYWGGNCFLANTVNTNKLLQHIRDFKEHLLRKPYSRIHTGSPSFDYWLRDIPTGNIKIFYTKKVKELIQRLTGGNIDQLAEELNSLPENPATEQDYEKAAHYDTLEINIKEYEETLEKMRETLSEHFGLNYGYTSQPKRRPEKTLDNESVDWNKIEKDFIATKQQLNSATKERNSMQEEMRNTW